MNIAAMTYDKRELLAAFHAEHGLGFPLLQDVDVRHVNAYGVRNEEYDVGHFGYGIPHPGILYVSPQGVVVAKFAVPGYRERPPLEEVYAAVAALAKAAE